MVTFTRLESTQLYAAALSEVSINAYSIAFWASPTTATGNEELGNSLTLEETWQHPGIYLFLKSQLGANNAELNPQQLSDRLEQFLVTPAVRNTRFLWIENPQNPVFKWRFHALSGILQNGTLILDRPTPLSFRNYQLRLSRYVRCRPNDAQDGFIFSRDAVHHAASPDAEQASPLPPPFALSTQYGAQRLSRFVEDEAGTAIALPVTGPQAGCFTFALTLENPDPASQTFAELSQMEIGLQLGFKAAYNAIYDNDHDASKTNNNSLTDAAIAATFIDTDPFSGFADIQDSEAFLITHRRYPFLTETRDPDVKFSTLTFNAVLDVLHPLNSDRTYFTFVTSPDSTTALPSCFRTNLGYPIYVTPHRAGQSKLIFAERPGEYRPNSNESLEIPFYLVPQGKYTLSVPRHQSTKDTASDTSTAANGNTPTVRPIDNFLCGLAGIEYIELSSEHVNILHFQAGNPGFSPDFVPHQAARNTEISFPLNNLSTTAWAFIEYEQAPSLPVYFSQPRQSLLYRADEQSSNNRTKTDEQASSDQGATGEQSSDNHTKTDEQASSDRADDSQSSNQVETDEPLKFFDIPVTRLPAMNYLPLFPYGGIQGDIKTYQEIEEQLINPQRRQEISALNHPESLPPPETGQDNLTGTTPQGLLANYSANFETLKTLTLAEGTDKQPLNLAQLERHTPLRTAFQSSQLFLVVSSAETLQEMSDDEPEQVISSYFPDNKLTIQGWTFDLDPANWRIGKEDFSNTILIFKFVDQKLIDLLKNPALWEQPGHFVGGADEVANLRDRLVEEFAAAIATVADDNASETEKGNAVPLARIATNPFWAGIVALNVNLPADSGLPAEIKALQCGIKDGDNLYARYVGSNGTLVVPREEKLEVKESSLFGLLNYQDDSIPEVGLSGYAFQVTRLRVQFQNSQVAAFSSEVNLTLDKLFGEQTLLLNSRSNRNIVILKGFTEEHDGVTTYAFSFSGENYFATPVSQVLNSVDIVKTEFATDPESGDVTVGRFTLWGRLNFRAIADMDLLSFGIDPLDFEQPLSFSDFQNNPREIALEALEILDRKGLLERQNLAGEAQTALSAAQSVVDDYANLIANGEALEGATPAIYNRALKAIQALRVAAPDILEMDNETVQLAVRTSHVDYVLEALQENEQFLSFAKLVIVMKCSSEEPPTFTFDPSQMTFDLKKSQVRSQSLYAKFPLKLVSFVNLSSGQTRPKGFVTVKTPLGGTALPDQGYGLNFELNLGSLGGLTGAAKFVANLMIVWTPNLEGSQKKPEIFVGFRLPGVGGDVLGFPLQSVIKFTFKSVELIRDRASEKAAYLLKIKKIALKFFVLSFPRSGQTEVVIFGNPDGGDSNDAIGWYAAYAKEKPPLPEGQAAGRSRRSQQSRR